MIIMLDKEKILKEQRLGQAMDRNYMGLDGKFGIILKALGKPVISQETSNYEVTEWISAYDMYEDEEGLPTEDPDSPISEMGKMFDALKFGYHIEITYMKEGTIPVKKNPGTINEYYVYEPAERVLKVSWKGYLVYCEAEGELHIFTPNSDWEDVVQKIYDSAVKVYKGKRKEAIIEAKVEDMQQKLTFLERLRRQWGI